MGADTFQRKSTRTVGVVMISAPVELWLFLLFAVWAALQLPTAGRVPALMGDEAWVLLRAREIAEGSWRLNGMNGYTGGLHLNFLASAFETFGYSATTLRVVAICLNAASMALFCAAVHRHWDDWLGTVVVAALFFSLPIFTAYGRLGLELTAIIPLLLAAAAWFAVLGRSAGHKALASRFVAGLLIGLATFTHVIAICVPAAIVVVFLIRHPVRTAGWLIPLALGAAIGGLPRLLTWIASAGAAEASEAALDFAPRVADLPHLPGILLSLWDGPLVYLRFSGLEDPWAMFPMTTGLLVAAAMARLIALLFGVGLRLGDVLPGIALFLSCLLIAVITPWFALRYFVLPSFLLPVLVARLVAPAFVSTSSSVKALPVILVMAVGAWHLAGLQRGYTTPHLEALNACEVFSIGERLNETSCHFTDVTDLFIYLLDRGVINVYAPPHIGWPLEAMDIEFDVLNVASGGPRGRGIGDTAVVVYDARFARGNDGPDLRAVSSFQGGHKQSDSPEHFIVFID